MSPEDQAHFPAEMVAGEGGGPSAEESVCSRMPDKKRGSTGMNSVSSEVGGEEGGGEGGIPWLTAWTAGVESELQLPAYTTATATRDLRHIYDLHHSSRQCRIVNPLSKGRD